jgi:hypothetical protein
MRGLLQACESGARNRADFAQKDGAGAPRAIRFSITFLPFFVLNRRRFMCSAASDEALLGEHVPRHFKAAMDR